MFKFKKFSTLFIVTTLIIVYLFSSLGLSIVDAAFFVPQPVTTSKPSTSTTQNNTSSGSSASISTSGYYIGPSGVKHSINNSSFVFQDYTTICSTTTTNQCQDKWTTSVSGCQYFNCGKNSDLYNSGYYWYWPNGNVDYLNTTNNPNNNCSSALVLDTYTHQILVYTPTYTPIDGCAIEFGSGSSQIAQTNSSTLIQGYQKYYIEGIDQQPLAPSGVRFSRPIPTGTLYNILGNSGSLSLTPELIQAGDTPFVWNSPTSISSVISNATLNQIPQSTQQTVINELTGGSQQYKNDLFYSTNSCKLGSGYGYQAVLAVNPNNPNQVVVLSSNNNTSLSDTGWNGQDSQCLNGGVNIKKNPSSYYGANQSSQVIGIGDVSNYTNPGSASPAGGGGSSSSPTISLNCDVNFNPLTWLLCPIVSGLASIIGVIQNVIFQQLNVGSNSNSSQPSNIFCLNGQQNKTCSAYEIAWQYVRDLALSLIVLIGLIIIIAQSLGYEFLSAYTVKKAMPRLVVATILIVLSWPLMQFFVQFTNDLGYSIQSLIAAPFASANINKVGLNFSTSGMALGLIAGAGALGLGIFGLLSFALTGALALFVTFIILIIRQILIIFLIIFSPIAIILFILPNTQKHFKRWLDEFSKALLMFPIIVALITVGQVFAAISTQGNNSTNILDQFVAFAGYFGPYFLVPATFRFAGSALASIGGSVKQAHGGMFGALSKYRKQLPAKRYKKAQANQLYSGRNAVSRKLGSLAQQATLAPSTLKANGIRGLNRSALSASSNATDYEIANEVSEKGSHTKNVSGNEDVLSAILNGQNYNDYKEHLLSRGKTKDEAERLATEASLAVHEAGGNLHAAKIAALKSAAGTTMFNTKDGVKNLMQYIDEISNGDDSLANNLIGNVRSSASSASNHLIGAASFGDFYKAYSEYQEGMHDPENDDAKKSKIQSDSVNKILDSAIDNGGPNVLLHGRDGSTTVLQNRAFERLDNAAENWDDKSEAKQRKFMQESAFMSATQTLMSSAPPANSRKFADNILSSSLDHHKSADSIKRMLNISGPLTVMSAVEGGRLNGGNVANGAFYQMERVYNNNNEAIQTTGSTQSPNGGPANGGPQGPTIPGVNGP